MARHRPNLDGLRLDVSSLYRRPRRFVYVERSPPRVRPDLAMLTLDMSNLHLRRPSAYVYRPRIARKDEGERRKDEGGKAEGLERLKAEGRKMNEFNSSFILPPSSFPEEEPRLAQRLALARARRSRTAQAGPRPNRAPPRRPDPTPEEIEAAKADLFRERLKAKGGRMK